MRINSSFAVFSRGKRGVSSQWEALPIRQSFLLITGSRRFASALSHLNYGVLSGGPPRLSAQPQTLDDRLVAVEVFAFEIPEQPAAPRHELLETEARVMVLRVLLHVRRQRLDPLRKDRD